MESTLKYISMFNLLNGVWKQKHQQLLKIYEFDKNNMYNDQSRLPALDAAEEVCYQRMMLKVRNQFEEHFVKEIEYIDQRNAMVKDILKVIFGNKYCRLYGGMVRDYVKNKESFYFLKFNDFDVKCASTIIASEILFGLECVFGEDCVKTISSIEPPRKMIISDADTNAIVLQKGFSVKTVLIKHRTLDLTMSMDLVSVSCDQVQTFDINVLKQGHIADFDVNQLYLTKEKFRGSKKKLTIGSFVEELSVESIKENIEKMTFNVFTNAGKIVTKHETQCVKVHQSSPIHFTFSEYPSHHNPDCIIADQSLTFYRSQSQLQLQLLNNDQDQDQDQDQIQIVKHKYVNALDQRGIKLMTRICRMERNGWKCATYKNDFCENPNCIFSEDCTREMHAKEFLCYVERIRKYRIRQRELRQQSQFEERRWFYQHVSFRFRFYSESDVKLIRDRENSKHIKSTNFDRKKKTRIERKGVKNGKSVKNHSTRKSIKHSDIIVDRFVKA